MGSATDTKTNRLAGEKSPYLLQHQHNPVDWFPWGEEAFATAKRENKPIFLSIGYSTCHWCHVMERESFENKEIAEILNANFVSIKVDREERPDLDKIYITAVQAMAGQGGWPLNCFLTPDLKPFFGATYFPPEPRHGRVGFPQVLEQIAELWRNRQGDVVSTADELTAKLREYTSQAPPDLLLHPRLLQTAAEKFKQTYDVQNGGFGNAPKFPHPSLPLFLLRQGFQAGDDDAVKMVLHTCERMSAGGIFDHIGGGFHRYSVDSQWLVPHFEKMLYDNAQLVNLYLDAFLVSGESSFADVARETIDYVLRDMTHPSGGFFSAEDADSEGKEGKFYCWTLKELTALLTPAELKAAVRYYGITKEGNFVDHSDPDPLPNQNILSIVDPEIPAGEELFLASAERKMQEARNRRIRPHRDDKVLASWNGMMLGALARAFAVLREERYLATAESNLAFIQKNLWEAPNTLHHRWREGECDFVQLVDDYANVLSGVLDLYEATLNPAHLGFAVQLADAMLAKFQDAQDGGFYQSATSSDELILRVKEDYDSAEPSGNSVAALALLRLAVITGNEQYQTAAGKTLRLFAQRLHSIPEAVPHLLMALDFYLQEPQRAAVVGDWTSPEIAPLLRAVHSVYQPNKVVLGNAGAVDPFTRSLPPGGNAMVYMCSGTACQPPTADPDQIRELLGNFTIAT